jgi:hypothetical protein
MDTAYLPSLVHVGKTGMFFVVAGFISGFKFLIKGFISGFKFLKKNCFAFCDILSFFCWFEKSL